MGNDDSELSDDRVVDCHKLSIYLLGALEIAENSLKVLENQTANSMVLQSQTKLMQAFYR